MATPPTHSETLAGSVGDPVRPSLGQVPPAPIELNAPDDFLPAGIPTADSPPVAATPQATLSSADATATARKSEVGNASTAVQDLPRIETTAPSRTPQPKKVETPRTVKGSCKDSQPVWVNTEEDEEETPQVDVIAAAPPWMVSLALHLILMVLLAIISLPALLDDSINLTVAFSETLGEQMDAENFSFEGMLEDNQISSQVEQEAVEDPLASPNHDLLEMSRQLVADSPFETPSIGIALTGREQGMKNTLLLAYGGDQTTELAVYRALEWLRKNQQKDGSWRLDGPYSDGSSGDIKNRLAATSMALLAFQGAGFTPDSTQHMINAKGEKVSVDYRRVVSRGWKKMLEWQDSDGCFYRRSKVDHPHHKLYSQAQATIALCELYAMTRDPKYARPAQRAVNYCCEVQDRDGEYPDGGWKYDEGTESDMSVTGWFVMALQSARMAGLDVPSDVFQHIETFLESVSDEGSYYSYTPGSYAKPSLTAEGLLCRQYLGWKRDDPRLIRGVEYLLEKPIAWNDPNTYYWYYATQVMHHMEGDYWYDWNQVMKREIPRKQTATGPEMGSWSPEGDIWGHGGGRLYMTCMCTYMLEVYYRHLPIYASLQ